MKIKRIVATATLALALTAGTATAASAGTVKTTTTTVTTTTTTTVTTVNAAKKAVKALPTKQAAKNAAAVKVADRKCGKWTATATKKVLDCRWTTLKANGYVAPKVPAKVYDSGEGTPDPGTPEWERAYGKALAPDAPPVSDSLAVDGPIKPRGKK